MKAFIFSLSLLFASAYAQENRPEDASPPYYIAAGVDYTYWRPYQSGMILAFYQGDLSNTGTLLEPNFYTRSGFKVFVDGTLMHDEMSLRLTYTWFNNPSSLSDIPFNTDLEFESLFLEDDPLASLQAKYKNQFNRLDGIIKREFTAGKFLSFTPAAGLLSAWDVQYFETNQIDTEDELIHVNNKEHFWGIGPYAAMTSTFSFHKYFGLFGKAGTSFLIANHKLTNYETFDEGDGPLVVEHQYLNENTIDPMVEASLGVYFYAPLKYCACKINIAWELQTYFYHSNFSATFYSPSYADDYSMQGLTIGAEFLY